MLIVSAYSGCGKSTFVKDCPEVGDSDSSQFPKEAFPQNYLSHIQGRIANQQCTFISSHLEVRQGLVEKYIPFIFVYPDKSCKEEYYKRYIDRAGTGGLMNADETEFAERMKANWDEWIDQCQSFQGGFHRVLQPGQFLADVVGYRNREFYLK